MKKFSSRGKENIEIIPSSPIQGRNRDSLFGRQCDWLIGLLGYLCAWFDVC